MSNYKRKSRKGFTLFHEHSEDIEILTDSEAGLILKAAFRYSIAGELPDRFSDRMLNSVWNSIKRDIDYSIDAWSEKCTQNAYNAYRRIEKDNAREPQSREDWEKNFISDNSMQGPTIVDHRRPSSTPDYQLELECKTKVESEIELESKTENKVESEIEVERKEKDYQGKENQTNHKSKDQWIDALAIRKAQYENGLA